MRAIQILCDEHEALREVLDALELVLDGQRVDDQLDGELAFDALQWFERFVDGLHQDREELGLFPRLEQRAPEETRRVLEELMRWHSDERRRLEEMRAQIEGAARGDPWSRDLFTDAARAYIEVQRKHSQVEDARLIPLARSVLTPEDDDLILAEYERLEHRHLRPGEPTPTERARQLLAHAARRVLRQRRGDPERTSASTPGQAATPRGTATRSGI
jgi:hemerythrin-like domain-containing protein